MVRWLAPAAALAAACAFDPSASVGEDAAAQPAIDARAPDARAHDAAPPDATPCDQPLKLVVRVNGVTVPAGEDGAACAPTLPGDAPYAEVLLGDTVELDASASCSSAGPLAFAWAIAPADGTSTTIEPAPSAPRITAYSSKADEDYVVSLAVTAPGEAPVTCTMFAFRTHGWQHLGTGPGNGDVRDVAFGNGILWVAAKDGAYLSPDVTGVFEVVDDIYGGQDPGPEMGSVWFDPASRLVWFAHNGSQTFVWRLDREDGLIATVPFDGAGALGGSAAVDELGPGAIGVQIATDKGVTTAPDNATFVGAIVPADTKVHALARGPSAAWGGGKFLWNLLASGVDLDPFGLAADNKIRGMAVNAATGELWIGSDDHGVALANAATGAPIAVWGAGDAGLGHGKVRDVAIEPSGPFAGDVWVATMSGVARFKRDRQVWVHMGALSGLGNRDDTKALAIDPATRTIYAASNKGIVYIRVP